MLRWVICQLAPIHLNNSRNDIRQLSTRDCADDSRPAVIKLTCNAGIRKEIGLVSFLTCGICHFYTFGSHMPVARWLPSFASSQPLIPASSLSGQIFRDYAHFMLDFRRGDSGLSAAWWCLISKSLSSWRWALASVVRERRDRFTRHARLRHLCYLMNSLFYSTSLALRHGDRALWLSCLEDGIRYFLG